MLQPEVAIVLCPRQWRFAVVEAGERRDTGRKTAGIWRIPADKGKTIYSPLAGREYSASAAENVQLSTKRVVTEHQQADDGLSETRNPGNVE
jgi:hypothetical protein